MGLRERFAGQILTLADAEAFIERAKVLGHGPKTPIGQIGVGLELYIETDQIAERYRCPSTAECKAEFEQEEMARNLGTGNIVCPTHSNNRSYTCNGSGRPGVPLK